MRFANGRLFWGLLVITLGVIWLLNNLSVTQVPLGDLISLYWPVVLLYFGLIGTLSAFSRASTNGQRRGILWGSVIINLVVVALGVIILGNNNGWFLIELSMLWKLFLPLVVMIAGLLLLRGGVDHPGARTYWAVMSGARIVRENWDDMAVIGLMGGATLDLTRAGLPEQEDVVIDVYTIMGGVDIKVPENVTVVCEWSSLMGGLEMNNRSAGAVLDHRTLSSGEGPRVRVRAVTVMGGVDIKRPGEKA